MSIKKIFIESTELINSDLKSLRGHHKLLNSVSMVTINKYMHDAQICLFDNSLHIDIMCTNFGAFIIICTILLVCNCTNNNYNHN